jgi:hypothetical protein
MSKDENDDDIECVYCHSTTHEYQHCTKRPRTILASRQPIKNKRKLTLKPVSISSTILSKETDQKQLSVTIHNHQPLKSKTLNELQQFIQWAQKQPSISNKSSLRDQNIQQEWIKYYQLYLASK